MAANAFLPEEIILQIVTRQPVKSVGRCRCVSTRWRSLFSDPHFAKSHFLLAPKHRALIFRKDTKKLQTLDFDLSDTTLFEKEPLLRDLNAPFYHNNQFMFLGSCNGLVALSLFPSNPYQDISFLIWNPSTGFFKNLPGRNNRDHRIFESGFGYVSATDEYKLVAGDEIFSSKTQTWKPMKIPPEASIPGKLSGVFFRGALHWLKCRRQRHVPSLYAFDLEKEELFIMKLPAAAAPVQMICDHGVTCEGCLYAVMVTNWGLDCGKLAYCDVVDFWVMKEYGNSDSWTRSFGVKIPKPSMDPWYVWHKTISVSGTSAFVRNICSGERPNVHSFSHYGKEEEKSDIYVIESDTSGMVVYEESLCRLD